MNVRGRRLESGAAQFKKPWPLTVQYRQSGNHGIGIEKMAAPHHRLGAVLDAVNAARDSSISSAFAVDRVFLRRAKYRRRIRCGKGAPVRSSESRPTQAGRQLELVQRHGEPETRALAERLRRRTSPPIR